MNNLILILRAFGKASVALGCLLGIICIPLCIIDMKKEPAQRNNRLEELLATACAVFNFLGWIVFLYADIIVRDKDNVFMDAFASSMFLVLIIGRIINKAKIRKLEKMLAMLDELIDEAEEQDNK